MEIEQLIIKCNYHLLIFSSLDLIASSGYYFGIRRYYSFTQSVIYLFEFRSWTMCFNHLQTSLKLFSVFPVIFALISTILLTNESFLCHLFMKLEHPSLLKTFYPHSLLIVSNNLYSSDYLYLFILSCFFSYPIISFSY